MKNKKLMIPLFAFLASLTACESNDLPIQHADSYRYITFAARTQKMTTRADDRYESYDPVLQMHPQNMGVFGYYNFATHSFETTGTEPGGKNHAIFDNIKVDYNTLTKTWSPKEEKRWDAYPDCNFDFFGYMPHSTEATLSKPSATESTYLLTIPFSMPSPILAQKDLIKAPIICAKPEHKGSIAAGGSDATFGRVVTFLFDQTLTGYNLNFQLDQKMNAIRHFRIKGVKIYGKGLATGGNVSRSYTWSNNEWTAKAIQWSNLNKVNITEKNAIQLAKDKNSENPFTPGGNESMDIDDSKYHRWGTTFYAIADASFVPTIAVTYDVILKDEKGETVTRKDVTSTIILGNKYFETLNPAQTAAIYNINILIQPRYLYVLADQDAYTGHLLIQ
jgi:hypothetical protein